MNEWMDGFVVRVRYEGRGWDGWIRLMQVGRMDEVDGQMDEWDRMGEVKRANRMD